MAKEKAKKAKELNLQHPKGMHDILPDDEVTWERVKRAARETATFYNFVRIDTPIVEHAELFEQTLGEATEVVEKQMFSFTSKGREKLVLRPEGTAPVARAYIEYGLSQMGLPLKLYYEGPFFRYEQPQAGRTRQFHQVGVEIFSADDDPIYDAQAILALWRLLEAVKLKNLTIAINSIGCKNCRPGYRKQLQNYYRNKSVCADCARRLETNPLRLLDCKVEGCRELRKDAPIMLDHLCENCRKHFKSTLEYLDELALPYTLDHYLVRGLDYYTKTVFEITGEGFPYSIAGGGRYDYLVETLGGKATPAVGWAAGMERIIEVMKLQNVNLGTRPKPKVFFIYIGDFAKRRSLLLIEELRKHGIEVAESLGRESLRGQLRIADKVGAPLALLFGQKEAFENTVIIRDLGTGVQETIALAKMVEIVKKRMKS